MQTVVQERNLNFDEVVERRGTNCLKYDAIYENDASYGDLLPLWIADMDFKASSFVQDALIRSVEHGVFGYTEPSAGYFKALQGFYRRRHNFEFDPSWVIKAPGVMMVLALAIRAFTNVGDAVLIQQPVYMHFADAVLDNGRKLVSSDLVYGGDGRYHIDFADFEKKIVENDVKMFLLCSPHNPVCRVWTREELLRIAGICLKHRVLVIADEIHSDFVFEGTHTMFASLSDEIAENSITVTAPTKTFNLAGLQIANAFIKNSKIRDAIQKQLYAVGYGLVGMQGLVAAQAAYEHGEEWLDALKKYLKANIDFMDKFVKENLPGVKLVPMDATYLAWLDFKGTGLNSAQVDALVRDKARLWLNSGTLFGKAGECFQRMNLACPRSVLEEATKRLAKAMG